MTTPSPPPPFPARSRANLIHTSNSLLSLVHCSGKTKKLRLAKAEADAEIKAYKDLMELEFAELQRAVSRFGAKKMVCRSSEW